MVFIRTRQQSKFNKKDGYRQRNIRQFTAISISLRHNLATPGESRRYVYAFTHFAGGGMWLPQESLRHILASPGYAPRTIAVNVTWMERWFTAGQTHHSMYPSIFNHLRARYWSEIAIFPTPLAFTFPVWGVPIGISGKKFGPQKTRIMRLPGR